MAILIGMSGSTQGVRLSASPPRSTSSTMIHPLLPAKPPASCWPDSAASRNARSLWCWRIHRAGPLLRSLPRGPSILPWVGFRGGRPLPGRVSAGAAAGEAWVQANSAKRFGCRGSGCGICAGDGQGDFDIQGFWRSARAVVAGLVTQCGLQGVCAGGGLRCHVAFETDGESGFIDRQLLLLEKESVTKWCGG